jgi:hypothetical protein
MAKNKKAYDSNKILSIPRTAEDKAAFNKELKDFAEKYGKVLSTGTELFSKLKAGKNKSIVQNAKRNIFEFPVFVASSVPLTYATATTTLLEQMYASFVQMTLSQTPVVDAKDIARGEKSGSDPFRYLRSADINDFLESYELEFQKDSVHNIIINEQVGNTYEFELVSYNDNTAEAILEAVEHMNVDPYAHFFQEADDPDAEAKKQAALEKAREAAKKAVDDAKKEAEHEEDRERLANAEQRAQNQDRRGRYKAVYDRQKSLDDHLKFQMDMSKTLYGTPPKMLKEGDINKLNTMKPLMMEAHFGAYTRNDKGQIGSIEQTSMIIGVRSYCRLVNSEELPEMAKYSDSKNVLMRHAKYRAGEMKYWSDFRFDIKGKKNDVYENIASPEKKWYKRLYQLAHMRDDAIAPLVAKGGAMHAINRISKASNGMIPNCSLVISQADVDYIKAITSQDGRTGINLLNPSTAKKLCSDMFLICLVVIDPDRESVKMFIPDLNSDWEVQSIDAINRQISTMNAAGIKSNEIFKALAR